MPDSPVVDDLDRSWPALLAGRTGLREDLLARYAEPHRRYHDRRHLREVLDRLQLLLGQPEAQAADRDAVVLAAWFHDAVHDGRPDDEERSAVLAETVLASCDVPAPLVAETARLVRLTRDHRPEPEDVSGQVLCDADLAILAADDARYAEYTAAVRAEYPLLDDDSFRTGRAEILAALLRGPLFHTRLARDRWEGDARANVGRELERLLPTPPD